MINGLSPVPAVSADEIKKIDREFADAWSMQSTAVESDQVQATGDRLELSCGLPLKIVASCCIRGFDVHQIEKKWSGR